MKDYGKLEAQRTSYLAKEEHLKAYYTQVSPMDFYRDVFVSGSLQAHGVEADGLGCAVFRFCPDKSTYKKLKDRIRGEYRDEVFKDSDELFKRFVKMFDAIPADDEEELQKRYDELDKKFHAGEYRQAGKPIQMTYIDKRTGEEKEAKFDQRVHDDLKELGEAIGKRFAYMAPISYFGKKANGTNARYLHAITLDLDGVGIKELKFLIAFIQNGAIPTPTYLVNSGHGMHLYYLLEEPEPLYRYARNPITKLKNALIDDIWNDRTSTIKRHKDDQPWGQMYRVVGSLTKLGTGYPTTAYKVGRPTTLEALNDFLLEQDRIQLPLEKYRPRGTSGHDLEYWKVENPKWYRKRILKEYDTSPSPNKFPWLYETFKQRIPRVARVGNRYNCMCVLFADAAQCGIPYEEAYKYAVSMLEFLNIGVDDEKDLFTREDIDCATKYYATDFGHFMTLERIERLTDMKFPRNKRNGNTQEEHLKMARYMRDEVRGKKDTWRDGNGRPKGSKDSKKRERKADSAEQVIRDYLQEHPDSSKAEVIRGTGLTKPTVYKWWKIIFKEDK